TADVDSVADKMSADGPSGEVRRVIDEEVNRLPTKYRAPFILCYLDGKTNTEAAQELGCPTGTVQSRLATARERLRLRLSRGGGALPTAGLFTALTAGRADAALPAALVAATLRAALLVAAGKAVAEAASASVCVLTRGVLQAMLWDKIKIVAVWAVAASVAALGGAAALQMAQAEATTSAGPVTAARESKAPPKAAATPQEAPPQAQPPAKAAKVYAFSMRNVPWSTVFEWYSDNSGLPYVGGVRPTGSFSFIPPQGKQFTLEEIT